MATEHWPRIKVLDDGMVATDEIMLETEAGGKSTRRRGTSAASTAEVYPGAPWMVNSVVSLRRCGDFPLSVAAAPSPQIRHKSHFIHHSLFHYLIERSATLPSPQFPRGSKNLVSLWLCGNSNLSGKQPLLNNLYQGLTPDSVAVPRFLRCALLHILLRQRSPVKKPRGDFV